MSDTTSFALRPLTLFSPSPTNPRQRMSAAEIDSLAESIAEHEVLQPMLARPKPNALPGEPPFEIVAGHRRWSACSKLAAAGRNPHGDSMPSLIRALTDAQVLAMQLVENIQREDLHPLEEAEHYRRMREDATAPASVEDIARVGKVSISRVYERLSLLQLVPAAREAFSADKLSLKTALQVARLPAAHQAEVTTHLADWGGEPMAPKAASAFIRDRYMLRLAQAPFDVADATLLPDAGACGACPKRTGANPQLFGDITDADTCTDTTCFASKKAAQRTRMVDELRVSGYTVLDGDKAREACTPDGRALAPGLHALDAQVPHALGDAALKIVDVLTRANAPNEHTRVIDHPSSPLITYGVPTAELEQHLRKIKAHRTQLDKAAGKNKAAAPAPAPASPAAVQAAAPAPQPGPTSPTSQWAAEPVDAAHDAMVRTLIDFTPAVLSGGLYHGRLTPDGYAREQTHRVNGILSAAEVVRVMQRDEGEGLPPFKLAQMLCVLLWWGESYLKLGEVAALCGLTAPNKRGQLRWNNSEEETQWLWDLTTAQAEVLAMAWLASQEANDSTPVLNRFAEAICLGLDIAPGPIHAKATAYVRERLHLGAMQQGEPADGKPKSKKAASVKYRCPQTGNTWSGRGLMPKWLRANMEQGRQLAEFAATAEAVNTNTTAKDAA